MGRPLHDLTGKVFGELTVLYRVGTVLPVRWMCRCTCGNESDRIAATLTDGTAQRCKSCSNKRVSEFHTRHGQAANGMMTRLYRIWCGMKSRAHSKSQSNQQKAYVDIWIEYEPWITSFESFRDWALANGYMDNLEIDRRNNLQGYSPENCRWVTRKVQQRNRRSCLMLTAFGETKTATDWAEDSRSKVSRDTMYDRKRAGWSDVDIVCTPYLKQHGIQI